MFLAPVLTVIRASGFGSAFGVATILICSCTVLPNEGDRFRVKRVEEAVLPMARAALEAEQTETAKRLYLRLLEVDPNSVTARMGLGDIAVAQRDSAEATRWYAAAVAHATRADERHAALLAHGRAALAGGDLKAARKSFSRLTSQRENAPTMNVAWGLNGLGLVALLEGDVREAIRLMEQAVLLAPEEKRLSDNLSRALELSAGIPPQSTSVDRIQDMVVVPEREALRDGQNPTRTDPVSPPAEDVSIEDRAREERIREAHRARQVDEREQQPPVNHVPRADVRPVVRPIVRPIDRSELRPYAIKVGGEYYVRIGAYDVRSEARAVASELGRLTAELVDVVEFGMGDGRNAVRLYRVLVGPIASRAGLIELIAALEHVGYAEARVPPSVAAESGRTAVPGRSTSTGQHSAGPELVEVSVGDETTSPATSAQEVRAVPEPGRQGAIAMSGVEAEAASSGRAAQAANDPVTTVDDAGPSRSGRNNGVATTGIGSEIAEAAEPQQRDEPPVMTAVGKPPASQAADPMVTAQRGVSSGLAHNGAEDVATAPRFLQVGAYKVRSTAEALAAEVGRVARAPVRVVQAELASGETMYRVQVGPISSREAMMELSEMLISGGYGTVRVLPEAAIDGAAEVPAFAPPPVVSPERRVRAFLVHEDAELFLQMGAYAVRSTADTLASQLRLVTSESVFVAETPKDDGGPLYRVRVGPIASDAALATLLGALRSRYSSGWVLPSIETDGKRTAFVVHEGPERFLQMGAYAARAAADALVSELRGQIDGDVRITEVSRGGGETIYRVRIGPIVSDESLWALVGAVESLGYVVD